MNSVRPVKQIIEPQLVIEGADVRLLRSIAPRRSNEFDPFLLFDHFAFNDPKEGPIRGFPTHPHRGIETVTYMLSGSVRHRDSLGNTGTIGPGDVQWMTAGGGILHEELPRLGPDNTIYGFQLWVNLPSHMKWTRPRYQEVSAATIPTFVKDGVTVRVVAGDISDVHGPVTEIAAEPVYLDVSLAPNTKFLYHIPNGHTAIAYVFQGQGQFGSEAETVSAVSMIEFGDGEQIKVQTDTDNPVRFMLIAGAPFKEPIAPYGPFVMNNMDEIQEALTDLRTGNFIWSETDPRFVG